MAKYFLVLLFSLLLITVSYAEDNHRSWDQGPLTWADFQEKNGVPGRTYLYYELSFETDKQEYGDTTLNRFVCKAYIDPDMSWADPVMQHPYNLKYHQTVFNYLEIQRRQLQKEMDRSLEWGEANLILSRNRRALEERIATLHVRTNAGSNQEMIDEYLGKSMMELEKPYTDGIPNVDYSDFKYGFNLMLGSSTFTQDIGEQFATPVSFSFGFEINYKDALIVLDVIGSTSKATKVMETDNRWEKDETATMNLIGVTFGYNVIESQRFVFYPFIGIGHAELRDGMNKNGDFDIKRGGTKPYLGFGVDYKFGPSMRLLPDWLLPYKHYQSQLKIKFKVYVHQPQYYSNMDGLSINFVLGIGGLWQYFVMLD